MSLFSLAFWKNALEHAVTAFAATFIALYVNSPTVDWHQAGLAAIAGGAAALYAFIKQLGGVQLANLTTKVAGAQHAMGTAALRAQKETNKPQ